MHCTELAGVIQDTGYYESYSLVWATHSAADSGPFDALELSFFADGDQLSTLPDPVADDFRDLVAGERARPSR